MKDHLSESEPIAPENLTGPQAPDTERSSGGHRKDPGSTGKTRRSGNCSSSPPDSAGYTGIRQTGTIREHAVGSSSIRTAKKRRTSRSFCERWWTPSVRSWFFTFMCMNMPIVGWFYLFHEARHEEAGTKRIRPGLPLLQTRIFSLQEP